MIGPVDPERTWCASCGARPWVAGHVCAPGVTFFEPSRDALLGRVAAAEAERDEANRDAAEWHRRCVEATDTIFEMRERAESAEAERDALRTALALAASASGVAEEDA